MGFKTVGCLSACCVVVVVFCLFYGFWFGCFFFLVYKKELSEMCVMTNIKQSVCGKNNIRSWWSYSRRAVLAGNSHTHSHLPRSHLPSARLSWSLYIHGGCCSDHRTVFKEARESWCLPVPSWWCSPSARCRVLVGNRRQFSFCKKLLCLDLAVDYRLIVAFSLIEGNFQMK